MDLFQRFKVKARFTLLISFISLISLTQGAILFSSNDNILGQATIIADIEIPLLNKAHELKLATVQVQQWLTDISATRAQDGLNDGFDEAEKQAKVFYKLIAELQLLDTKNSQRYEGLKPVFDAYYKAGKRMAQSYIDEGPEGGNKMMGNFDAAAARMTETVDEFLAQSIIRSKEALEEEKSLMSETVTIISVTVLSVLIGLALLYFIMTKMVKTLTLLPPVVNKLASGDLTTVFDASGQDEISQIMGSLNELQIKLQNMVKQMQDTGVHLNQTAGRLSTKASDASVDAQKLYAETEQVAAAMNEMNSTVTEVANNTDKTALSAETANKETKAGKELVDKTVVDMRSLSEKIDNGATTIRELEENSESISKVLEVIQGIAEQTNLLALNAAIEAARAGEQGRGFAVVADEVRTLAGRTQESTEEIRSMIDKLQTGSRQAVEVMDSSCEKAAETVNKAVSAGASLNTIADSVELITAMSAQIAHAGKEQETVVEEVARSVVKIHDTASRAADESKETVTLSEQLLELSVALEGMTNQFKT